MLVKEIMAKNVVSVSPDETLNQALSAMRKYRIHQLPVMSGGSLYGMLELKKIVSRDVDVTTAKVAGLAVKVPTIDANASVESAADLLLRSGWRAVPVTDAGSLAGLISESDIMKVARQFVKGLNQSASEIITPADYLDKESNYGSVKKLVFEKNISRVPIVENGKILGIVSTFEMMRVLEGRQTMETRGSQIQEKVSKEKVRMDDTPVTAIMRPAAVISGEKMIGDVIEMLKENEEAVVQTENSIGVITPRDILELFASPKKQLYVQITGMHDESVEFQIKMDHALSEFVQKINKMVPRIEYLVVHVERMHKQGPKEKYSIRARFKAPMGFFVAHAWGWKPVDVIQDVFKNLEREIIKKRGKIDDLARMRRQKPRYS